MANGIKKKMAKRYLKEVRGNVLEAELNYIALEGCNGFRCKGCICGLVCDHVPAHANNVAMGILRQVIEERSKKKVESLERINQKFTSQSHTS